MQRSDRLEQRAPRARRAGMALLAALLLGTAGLAAANHYPPEPGSVRVKDRNVLSALRRLTYAYAYEQPLAADSCYCIEPTCDGDNHFMLSCGGEFDPPFSGLLTATRRTSRETCLVCGCAVIPTTLRATPVCAGF